ncbi:hypothetical protein DB42_AC00030 [Neochlamydia sp. EPS4]|nr:hypothetical protein DB42_AC00030 [Neochlamydia sp. EPS4]
MAIKVNFNLKVGAKDPRSWFRAINKHTIYYEINLDVLSGQNSAKKKNYNRKCKRSIKKTLLNRA